MLRLIPQAASRWLDLDKLGVRLKLRPLDTAVLAAARSEALKRVAALWAEAEAQAKAGFPMDPAGPTMANPNWRSGIQQQFLAEALLRYAVEAWEGVAGEDGAPLPLGPASIQAFAAHDSAAQAFLQEAFATLDVATAEGNVSAPSSPGAGDEGATTAQDAPTAAAPPVLLS